MGKPKIVKYQLKIDDQPNIMHIGEIVKFIKSSYAEGFTLNLKLESRKNMSYCKIITMGRLVNDPENKVISTGTPLTEFRMAFDNGWGDNKKTCFVGVTVWGKQAEFVALHFKKGDGILVDGRLDFDQWEDKNGGGKRSKHYITAERVTFPISSGQGNTSKTNQKTQAVNNENEPASKVERWNAGEDIDEIPF